MYIVETRYPILKLIISRPPIYYIKEAAYMNIRTIASIFTLCIMAFFVKNAFAVEGGLLNGSDYSFESTTLAGNPWNNISTPSVDAAVSTDIAYSGSKSVKVVHVDSNEGRGIESAFIAISPGMKYSASIEAYTTYTDIMVDIEIIWYDSGYNMLGYSGQMPSLTPGTWTRCQANNITVGASAAYAKVGIYPVDSYLTDSTVYLDNACLIQATTAVDDWPAYNGR